MTTSALQPAASARRTIASVNARSGWMYSWNHSRAPGARADTSSTATVDAMLTIMIVSAAAAARAVAGSPSGWASRWNAVGATMTGIEARSRRSVTPRSRFAAPRRTRGHRDSRASAASLARSVTSSPAPPAK